MDPKAANRMLVPLQAAAALFLLIHIGVDPRAQAAHPEEEINYAPPHANGVYGYAPVQGAVAEQRWLSPYKIPTKNVAVPYDEAGRLPYPQQDEGTTIKSAKGAYPEGSPTKLPSIYGVKTLLLGLLVLSVLMYSSVFSAEEKNDGRGKGQFMAHKWLTNTSDKPGKRIRMPFQALDQPAAWIFIGSLVFILSGSYKLYASLMRRQKAKEGYAVSMHPPMTGLTLFSIGLLLGVVSILGLVANVHMAFFGVLYVACSIMAAAKLLLLWSILDSFWDKMK